jgi:esterase/lipase superfamily enzyme
MNRQYHSLFSQTCGKSFEMLRFGTSGKAMLVFPSSEGRFFDYENFGMIETLTPFIDSGKIQVFCIDSFDRESWYAPIPPADKARRANDFNHAVVHEIVPLIHSLIGSPQKLIAHGCSFGGYQASVFFLRHPEIFDTGISLSGNVSIRFTLGDFFNDDVYFNDPLMFVPNMHDSGQLDRLRENFLILCCGQGAWEEWQGESRELDYYLSVKGIPHVLDLWGYDVNHDWNWWKPQIVHFLGKLERVGLLQEPFELTPKAVHRLNNDFYTI